MKIVNCALLYADGDKYVWSVVTEGASEFPIDMDLVADGSIWENDGVKSVLTDGSWVAESSGGFNPPRVIFGETVSDLITCDTSYDDFLGLISEWGFGLGSIPVLVVSAETFWGTAYKDTDTNYIKIVGDDIAVYYLSDGTITPIKPSA